MQALHSDVAFPAVFTSRPTNDRKSCQSLIVEFVEAYNEPGTLEKVRGSAAGGDAIPCSRAL